MIKHIFVAVFLCGMSCMANAEAWLVDVYESNDLILSLTVPVGECVKGSLLGGTLLKPVKIMQEICVTKSGDTTHIKGRLFAPDRIGNLSLNSKRGAADLRTLNYGQPINVDIDGGYAAFTSGDYTVSSTRTMSF